MAHVDFQRDFPATTIQNALNYHLRPAPIAILACEAADEHFDARFSAIARHYLYLIENRRAPLALDRDRVWQVPAPLNEAAMEEAASGLLGRHDFTTFRSVQCQGKSPIRTLDKLSIRRDGDSILVSASARSFLHHQVRSMVGSLKLVGEGKWEPERVREALDARDRAACGPVAPACGLYFMKVDY